MRTLGVYLIYAAVVLRGAVVTRDAPYFYTALGYLAVYGILLLIESWAIHCKPSLLSWHVRLIYLLVQSAIVIGLMIASDYDEDFFANLFVPLSLDAVSFFGRRLGLIIIAAFSLAMVIVFRFSEEGQIFGLAMAGLYSGVCFLFGGYASQVLKAEAAREQNRRTFNELQIAHRQLQGYADQIENLAIEHERNRLARDLHDSVTQTVFSMNLAAQSARLLLDKDPPRASCSAQLLRLEELSANALHEIQSLVSQLKPRSIVEEGLSTALRRLADEREARDGLRVSVEIQGEKTLFEAEMLGLYSIAHEALTNVVKHSGVQEASVRLSLGEDHSRLEVEDHGLGFEPGTATGQRGHLGLAGMSERACEIGWRLSVESGKGLGTRILVTQDQAGGAE